MQMCFYELGIAHTLGKEVVLIRQKSGESAPFDLNPWRYFEYDITPKAADLFKQQLKMILTRKLHLDETMPQP